jgi:hypothetical protein
LGCGSEAQQTFSPFPTDADLYLLFVIDPGPVVSESHLLRADDSIVLEPDEQADVLLIPVEEEFLRERAPELDESRFGEIEIEIGEQCGLDRLSPDRRYRRITFPGATPVWQSELSARLSLTKTTFSQHSILTGLSLRVPTLFDERCGLPENAVLTPIGPRAEVFPPGIEISGRSLATPKFRDSVWLDNERLLVQSIQFVVLLERDLGFLDTPKHVLAPPTEGHQFTALRRSPDGRLVAATTQSSGRGGRLYDLSVDDDGIHVVRTAVWIQTSSSATPRSHQVVGAQRLTAVATRPVDGTPHVLGAASDTIYVGDANTDSWTMKSLTQRIRLEPRAITVASVRPKTAPVHTWAMTADELFFRSDDGGPFEQVNPELPSQIVGCGGQPDECGYRGVERIGVQSGLAYASDAHPEGWLFVSLNSCALLLAFRPSDQCVTTVPFATGQAPPSGRSLWAHRMTRHAFGLTLVQGGWVHELVLEP